jgi:O-methyltransferase
MQCSTIARRVLIWFLPTSRVDQISRDYWQARSVFKNFAEDVRLSGDFLRDSSIPISFLARLRFVIQCLWISQRINCPHTQGEILAFARMILLAPPGVIVEAGCFKGGSTAKFSLIAEQAGRDLVVFDSFQGIPENTEPHEKDMSGYPISFKAGCYAGSIDEVKANVTRYGRIDRCRFIPGWFEETMPYFTESVAAAYIDVDLASSTATCLRYLYPTVVPSGFLASQDGHLPLVIEVLKEWQMKHDLEFHGLGNSKFVWISKTANSIVGTSSNGLVTEASQAVVS